MLPVTIFSAAVLAVALVGAHGSKILAVFPFQSKSHFVMLEALAKGLAARGHSVTVVGHFPQKTPIPNYKDISLEGTTPQLLNSVPLEYIFENWRPPLALLNFIWRSAGTDHCERMYKTSVLQNLIASNESFDLVISELWGSDCFLPLANKFHAPHISLLTTMEIPWSLSRYGSPINPAYMVTPYLQFLPETMNFWNRLLNTIFVAYARIGYYLRSEVPSNRIAKTYLGDAIPDLSEVMKNSSLLLVNSHFSILGSRPFSPNVIEVGGLHIEDPKPLPPNLKKILDEAKDGVIIVSFGSLIRPDSLDGRIIDSFVESFRKLPQTIIWKFNGTIKNLPDNVMTLKWLPQNDLLRHPNVKLFVTHGGLMGTQEGITAGVPMLGIPFFADQHFNILTYQHKGFAIKLDLEDITPENVRTTIQELLQNPRYAEKAKHYSKLFMDRPQTALETAVYWTEYVIRHKGARHMRSPAIDLSFVQYHLLDVYLFLLGSILASLFVLVTVVKKSLYFCTGNRSNGKKQKRQ